MAILVGLHHVTRYTYDRPVALGPQSIRLRPAPHCRTRVPSYSLKVTPANHFVNWQQDPHGNWLARFVFPEKVEEFKIEVDLTAELAVINPFDFFVEPYAEEFPFAYTDELETELAAYLEPEPAGPLLQKLSRRKSRRGASGTIRFPGRPQRRTAADDPLRHPHGAGRAGAGRDAGAALGLVPRLGLAAGADPAPARPRRALRLRLSDPAASPTSIRSRARAARTRISPTCTPGPRSIFPGAGWIGMDATSGLFCGEGHMPLCATPHYRSAAPITGVVEPAQVDFGFDMNVTRLREAPRVTLPFTDDAWSALDALGEAVDRDLVAQDVRLTMGGEPTFVSIDDFDAPEWNTAAVGGPSGRAPTS